MVELGVEALLFEELAMGASLNNLPVFENDDLVGVENSFEAVSDDKARPSSNNRFHGSLDFAFGHGVNI